MKRATAHPSDAVARSAGSDAIFCWRTWGLRPRLYAHACIAGYDRNHALCLRLLRRL